MRCFLPNCSNFKRSPMTKLSKKSHGLTFHVIPQEQHLRQAWLAALGMSEGEPNGDSMVCSEHFRKEDFYETKGGQLKLKNNAVPITGIVSDDMNAPAALRTCRICMSMDIKMYDASHYQLGKVYEQLTRTEWSDEDFLPQKFCWECAGRLVSFSKFKSKALKSLRVMLEILNSCSYLTVKDVKAASQTHRDVNSSLTENLLKPNDYDWNVECDDNFEPSCLSDDQDVEVEIKAERPERSEKQTKIKIEPEILNEPEFALVKDEISDTFFSEYFSTDQYSSDSEDLEEFIESSLMGKKPKEKPKVEKKKKVLVKKEKKLKVQKKPEAGDRPKIRPTRPKTSKIRVADLSTFEITILSPEEQMAELLKRKESTSYTEAPLQCNFCYRGFLTKETADTHALKHSEKTGHFECSICKYRYRRNCALTRHIESTHTEILKCKLCPFVTTRRDVAVREHLPLHNGGLTFQCPHCTASFNKRTSYFSHLRIKHASQFVCEYCGYAFVSEKGVKQHKTLGHRFLDKNVTLEGPYCAVCDVKFVSEEAHARHLQLSSKHSNDDNRNRVRNDWHEVSRLPRKAGISEQKPVTCEQCNKQFSRLALYAHHFRSAHPGDTRTQYPAYAKEPAMCDLCGKMSQCAGALKRHMFEKHNIGEMRYKCDHCPRTYALKNYLAKHMRVHNGLPRRYQCDKCEKSYATKANLDFHKSVHSGKPRERFKCNFCEKSYLKKVERNNHMRRKCTAARGQLTVKANP